MTTLTLLCWQEIPSLVEAKDESGAHKVQLSQKFQDLIDLAAMKRGLGGSDDYLLHWQKEKYPDSDAEAKPAAEALAAEIEAKYDQILSDALAKS
ncbi:MAG: virulence factor [Methyloligellaceae bacterium]